MNKPDVLTKLKDTYGEFRTEVTEWAYMNLLSGWTTEQCDNHVWIVDESKPFKFDITIPERSED